MSIERERQTQAAARTRAATKINMTLRGHLARNRARQLRSPPLIRSAPLRRASMSCGCRSTGAR